MASTRARTPGAGTSTSTPVKRRRRGAELEEAILDAAWEELVDVGYGRLTMESVASRAKTGIAVLYRRWSNKDDLVLAALRRYNIVHSTVTPDTGSLRGDLVELLEGMGSARTDLVTVISTAVTSLHDNTGMAPVDVRQFVLGDRPRRSATVFRRADERGEIDLAKIPAVVLDLPFQLVIQATLMTLKPVTSQQVVQIVDEIFFPLLKAYGALKRSDHA